MNPHQLTILKNLNSPQAISLIMKRISAFFLVTLCCVCYVFPAAAQSGPYGNEWIDYGSKYYKLKIAKPGIYRVTRAELNAAGVPPNVAGSNYKLYRDGLELPIYVSAETMGSNDYIEFAGRGADGLLDRELYPNPQWQLNPNVSLFTDTAAYYLSYDNTAGHLRYTQATNAIPTTPPAAETYNWATSGIYYRNAVMEGPSHDTTLGYPSSPNPGNPFFSPSFQNGEGLVGSQLGLGSTASLLLATPNVATVAVAAILRTNLSNRTYHAQPNINISLNGTAVGTAAWPSSSTKSITASVPATVLSPNTTVLFTPVVGPRSSYDIYGIAFAEIQYPRNYDVAGLNYFAFKLSASGGNQYLEFSNVAGAARLYDVTSSKWYDGDVAGGKTRFYIQSSLIERSLILSVAGGANSPGIAKTIQFKNYTQTANQGDYLIISHSKLMQPFNGEDQIARYKAYRSTSEGGLHTVQVADVNDLYDEFAYGYDTHPLSIKHFLKYAYDNWSIKPVAVNIIGHGLQYEQYPEYYSKPSIYTFPIVPVYGNPGSDNCFVNFGVGTDRTQKLQVGRISVWDNKEVNTYLNKVIAYEAAIKTAPFPTATTELWKKKVMHIIGALSRDELNTLAPSLEAGRKIIEDTLLGDVVYNFYSDNTTPGTQIGLVDSLLANGVNMVTYLGHASPTTLFYNLPEPETINSLPRIPVFLALGCDVAQMFGASVGKTYSEKYTLAPTAGSIALMATDNYGYTDFLHDYLIAYYKSISYQNYGASLGAHTMATYNSIYALQQTQGNDINGSAYFAQLESQILNGDPMLPLFAPKKPDYHVSLEGVSTMPASVSTSLDSFRIRIISHNIGRAAHDPVVVKVEHRTPAGTLTDTRSYTINGLMNTDTSYVWMPVNKLKDLGLNKYTIKIDAPDQYDEQSELNNTAELELFIYSDNLIPIYPYEFSIVHQQGVTLKASTLNVFRPMGRYVMEIDTTIQFNSPSKQQATINSRGGVIKWTPAVQMTDSTVYYWRCAIDSNANGVRQWGNSSFIYLAKGSDGWNQSHYYQYLQDGYNNLNLPQDRNFSYPFRDNLLEIYAGVVGYPGAELNKTDYNTTNIQRGAQSAAGALAIMVYDSVTGNSWKNSYYPNQRPGSYGYSDFTKGYHQIEFLTYSLQGRQAAMHYLDSIPNGNYIVLHNVFYEGVSPDVFVNEWKADTAVLGHDNSLYHTMKRIGFSKIDSFTHPMVFISALKKGRPASEFAPQDTFANPGTQAKLSVIIKSHDKYGDLQSTVIGPAQQWQELKWKMHSNDTLAYNDTASIAIYGIRANGDETFLYTGTTRDTSLAFISAATYPKIRMEWRTADSVSVSAPQLNYWRIIYQPLPEAALNPALNFAFADSLQVGQEQTLTVAVENLTPLPMDSLLISYKVINASGVTSNLPGSPKRFRKLPGNDTLNASISFDPKNYPGVNNLFVEVNPAGDQPEQYHPNNLGYLPFTINVDTRNPLLDVTFDGIHILNNDIVSAQPLIKILLKDENNYLALDDTSLLSITLEGQKAEHKKMPISFDGVTVKFIPGQTGNKETNEAVVEISKKLEDDIYTLSVSGKDRSNNMAGTPAGNKNTASYKVAFEVVNKPTITNVLNYPNPFSTSTAFLFTITGSQLPSQLKIQILSVTGKVVREITKDELGPLHIGRNITSYKWDGRDQYGQLLGNGVYMYRIASSLNGNDIEHRSGGEDKYFKNGYGKMYIMR